MMLPDNQEPRGAVVCKRCNEQGRLVYLNEENNFAVECCCGVQVIDSVEWGERRADDDGLDWTWSNQSQEHD